MTARFEIGETTISGVYLLGRIPIADERGWLERMYATDDLAGVLGGRGIAQVNRTLTAGTGTVRGLHYQRQPSAEVKIVSCLRGAAFDVAVDLRRGSPTFLHWHAETLSAENHRSLVIPEGVAHGFQALADDCELLYLHTAAFDPASEGGLHPGDPRLAIAWPLPIERLSERDASHPLIGSTFDGIVV